jgi:hypothetical protein
MQDAIAIAVSIAAGVWLVRTLWRQVASPSCAKTTHPSGADGFVSVGDLTASTTRTDTKKPGRPVERPGS